MKQGCIWAMLVFAVGVAGAQSKEGQQRPVVDPSAPKPSGPQRPVVDPGNAAKAPSDAIVLFDGKDNSHWRTQDGQPSKCSAADGVMSCRTGSGTIASTDKFKSAQIHLEFNIPDMPDQHGQLKGNSGAILQGRYEVQILDSYQNPTYADGSCGALYGQSAPAVNASRRPGEWQTYDIVFHAPRCAPDGTLAAPGTLTLLHNGVLVQDHVPVQSRRGCVEEGPLVLQDHSNFPNAPDTTMRFRNIWMRPLP
jgi:hypothetical protein